MYTFKNSWVLLYALQIRRDLIWFQCKERWMNHTFASDCTIPSGVFMKIGVTQYDITYGKINPIWNTTWYHTSDCSYPRSPPPPEDCSVLGGELPMAVSCIHVEKRQLAGICSTLCYLSWRLEEIQYRYLDRWPQSLFGRSPLDTVVSSCSSHLSFVWSALYTFSSFSFTVFLQN